MLKEIREKILNAENKDLFLNLEIHFEAKATGINRKFKGVLGFYEYLEDQIIGIEKMGDGIFSELKESLEIFNNIKKQVDQFVKNETNKNPSNFNNSWVNLSRNFPRNQRVLEYDAPQTLFLLEIFKNKPVYFEGALHYLTGGVSSGRISERNYFNGILIGYEYFLKGETEIEKRREMEKASLTKLRDQVNKYISSSENDFVNHLTELKENVKSTADQIINFKDQSSIDFNIWYSEVLEKEKEYKKTSKDRIVQLETTYEEKLKLEKPADYWQERALALRKDGWIWLRWLIGFTVGGAVLLFALLILITTGNFEILFNSVGSAIKWSIVLITFISFIAFGMRTFSKLAFSSFHLVRDAEERRQLVYVFLSLSNERDMDKEERNLIIQSIFSRADSGLLKEDSSPTMPGSYSILEKLFR